MSDEPCDTAPGEERYCPKCGGFQPTCWNDHCEACEHWT